MIKEFQEQQRKIQASMEQTKLTMRECDKAIRLGQALLMWRIQYERQKKNQAGIEIN